MHALASTVTCTALLQNLIHTMFGIYTARGHDELSKVCAQAASAAAPSTEEG